MISRTARWSLPRRLEITIVVAGAVILGVVAFSAYLLQETRHQQEIVTERYYAAGRIVSDYYIGLVDSETAVRGFAVSREDSALEPVRAAERFRPGATAEAGRELQAADDPGSADRLIRVEAAAQRWYEVWALPTVAQLQAGGPLTNEQIARGQDLFDEVRASYAVYLAESRAGRAAALDRLQSLSSLLFYAVVVSALAVIAILIALWWLLRSWVSNPVAALAAETRVVSGGRLDHAVRVDGPPEFVGLGADIEAMRRRLVDQIAEVESAGREISAARTRLEEQATELQRSNRELEQFAYVASHDLQEPLRKVASFCQLLEKRYAGQLDERADQYIEFAVDGAKRMQRLINELLEFSRVGRSAAGFDEVQLGPVLDAALDNLSTAIDESGAHVSAGPLPAVCGEAGLLTQLLQNLVGNALKFRTEGSVPEVRIGAERRGELWEFACADNGIGIAPEYAERVFVIFQRLHPKDVYGGTGIGLAMCKKIVEHHGGTIWVDETVTAGATIRWTLPAVPGAATGAEGAGDGAAVDRVVVVDGVDGDGGDGARAGRFGARPAARVR